MRLNLAMQFTIYDAIANLLKLTQIYSNFFTQQIRHDSQGESDYL